MNIERQEPDSALTLTFDTDGAERHRDLVNSHHIDALRLLADRLLNGRPGARIFAEPELAPLLTSGSLGHLARSALGMNSRPVRAVIFDKTEDANWRVPWHQDRTIAVQERVDVPGFGPWSIKDGIHHVEPPFAVTDSMVTLRAHLDSCDADNAALLVARGSHRFGRISASNIPAIVEALDQAVCVAEAGDVWLYATAIVHASEPAKRPQRRRVLQVDYANIDLPAGLNWLGIGL